MVSPYDVLMVDQDADSEEIERAYRERVKQTHPDHGGSLEEFQLVKSAYKEIQSDFPTTRGATNQNRRKSESEQPLMCSKCRSPIQQVSDVTYSKEAGKVFCPDCIVDTNCRDCGNKLVLSIDQFSSVDGEPICKSCYQKRHTLQSRSRPEATYTTTDSRSIPFWVHFVIFAALSALAVWYYRPILVVSLSPETTRNILRAVAGPGILFLLWALWKR